MQKNFFKLLAKCNKLLLPSLTKKRLDIGKASKAQLLLVAWRSYVTMRALP
ncbi:MAG: SsrA-binding protein [Flavobacteriaceae bacterium]|nr:SsrA-binding protein [Flavobacteriaceae bacterium]